MKATLCFFSMMIAQWADVFLPHGDILSSYINLESSDAIFYCIQLIKVGITISLIDIKKYLH